MVGTTLAKPHWSVSTVKKSHSGRNLHLAQQAIYQFLLEIVKKWPPEEVLLEFKRLFLYHVDSVNSAAINALYEIVLSADESEFRNTVKRSCYILVNNWDAARRYQSIQDLVFAFQEESASLATISPTITRLRQWIRNFRNSADYKDLELFITRYDDTHAAEKGPWSKRYTAYLLVPQYADTRNPIEQREAARALAQQLRDKFKFDLAMYVARSQSGIPTDRPLNNPTALGDDALRLVKMIVAKRGTYSHTNLANIFLAQTEQLRFHEFKASLEKYLLFSVESSELSRGMRSRLSEKLIPLYSEYDSSTITDALLLRTCNRVIDFLTTDNQKDPSPLFILLLSQGNPMTLVVTLLKLILISKNSRTHLEARIADLIRYYESMPEQDCHWVVNFLEIFNVTFTIYAENVQYNLIRMDDRESKSGDNGTSEVMDEFTDRQVGKGRFSDAFELDSYRVFSQLKTAPPIPAIPESLDVEPLELDTPAAESIEEAPFVSEQPAPEAVIRDPEAFPLLTDLSQSALFR